MEVINYSELFKAVNEAKTAPIKIYYNRFSGEILGHCPKEQEIHIEDPFIIVAYALASKALENISNWMIAFDKDTNKVRPVKKNEIIKLLNPETKLFEIPKIEYISGEKLLPEFPKPNINPLYIDYADISVTIYKEDSILTLSLNPIIINRLSAPLLLSQLQFEKGSALNLFITRKKDPNAMIKSIYVDLNDFLSESKNIKTLEYDISDILQNASTDEISIYTRRIFERYAWQVKERFIPTYKAKGISKKLLNKLESENCHLVIVAEAPNVMTVQLVNELDLDKYQLTEFIAFLDEKNNPYSMSGSIKIELHELKRNKVITLRTEHMIDTAKDIAWPNKELNIKFIPYASPYN
jgi:hypothetical protein